MTAQGCGTGCPQPLQAVPEAEAKGRKLDGILQNEMDAVVSASGVHPKANRRCENVDECRGWIIAGEPPQGIRQDDPLRSSVLAPRPFAAAVGVAYSAMMAKERGLAPALAVSVQDVARHTPGEAESLPLLATAAIDSAAPEVEIEFTPIEKPSDPVADEAFPADTRWFNGRPVRPTGVLRMRVTAYSPDAHSCGDSADGLTATLHSVETNAFQLVAADPRVLKYGSLITVPGYADDAIVPVLDCGGKIKGSRLDVLYPTHAEAKRWGSRWLTVTLWTYADGKPAGNPRKLR